MTIGEASRSSRQFRKTQREQRLNHGDIFIWDERGHLDEPDVTAVDGERHIRRRTSVRVVWCVWRNCFGLIRLMIVALMMVDSLVGCRWWIYCTRVWSNLERCRRGAHSVHDSYISNGMICYLYLLVSGLLSRRRRRQRSVVFGWLIRFDSIRFRPMSRPISASQQVQESIRATAKLKVEFHTILGCSIRRRRDGVVKQFNRNMYGRKRWNTSGWRNNGLKDGVKTTMERRRLILVGANG